MTPSTSEPARGPGHVDFDIALMPGERCGDYCPACGDGEPVPAALEPAELERRAALFRAAITSDPTLGGLFEPARLELAGCEHGPGPRSTCETCGPALERLEELRAELRAERISYGELAELADLADYIGPGDVELLEPAGVPEFEHDAADCPRLPATGWHAGRS